MGPGESSRIKRMMIHRIGERSKRPSDAPVMSMTRLSKNCSPSVVTSAFFKGADGDSAVIETPSIVAEFKGDLDGEDRVLIDAVSPVGRFRTRDVRVPSSLVFSRVILRQDKILVTEADRQKLSKSRGFSEISIGNIVGACSPVERIGSQLSMGF